MQLQGKTAIVTGAAGGLGAGIARAFAREGAAVCIADVDLAGAQRTAQELAAAGSRAIAVRMDVTSEEDVRQGVDAAATALGGLDILVSNAGIQHLDLIADL